MVGNFFTSGIASKLTLSLGLNDTERNLAEAMQANLLHLLPAFKAGLLHEKSIPEEFANKLAEVRSFVRPSSSFLHTGTILGCYEGGPRPTFSSSEIFEVGLRHGGPE